MKTEDEMIRFTELLDEQYQWPTDYTFKFIVPRFKESALLEKLPSGQISKKLSRSGKYISITNKVKVSDGREVLAIYQEARTIDGVISL